MPKGSSKREKREDSSQAARRVVDTVIERSEADAEPEIEITPEMRAAAAAFGRIGGRIGGPRRAEALSARKRSEIAKKAAAARWKGDK
ncbi:MAG TPA: hypothetical protein VF858_10190 [Gemmatimonadaceae bacterium]